MKRGSQVLASPRSVTNSMNLRRPPQLGHLSASTSYGKFQAYKQIPSLREYVLVAQDQRRVEVYRPNNGTWSPEVGGPGETVMIHGRSISVDDVYEQSRRAHRLGQQGH